MTRWLAIGMGVAAAVAGLLFARRLAPPMPTCIEKWAVHHGGQRPLTSLRLIVLHSTEGPSAASAAGWFQNPASGGSTHYVVDDHECYHTLPDDVVPWGAQGGLANENGLHIEQAGFAAWSRAEWLQHTATLRKAAGLIAAWGRRYEIPMLFLDAAALRAAGAAARGITTHAEITKAFGIVGGHTDPGAGYPIDTLFNMLGVLTPGGRVV